MSAQTTTLRVRAPGQAPATAPGTRRRTRLSVIPSPVPARSRAPFVSLLALILLAALATVLVLNIRMAQAAYDLHDRQMELAVVQESVGELRSEVDLAGTPTRLEERALELGMVRPDVTYYIELASRTIVGPDGQDG